MPWPYSFHHVHHQVRKVSATPGVRSGTAYRDAFQQNLYHTWKQMSRQTLVIRRGPGSPAVTQGAKPNGRS